MSTPETTEPAQEAPVEALEAPTLSAPEAGATIPDIRDEPEAPAADPQVKKLRDEAAKWRTQLRETEERVKALEREKLSETDRVRAERDEAVQEAGRLREHARTESLAAAAVRVGAQLGLNDPDDAIRLIPASSFEYDDNGNPSNISQLVQGLISEKPYLVKQQGRRGPDAGLVPGGQQTGAHQVPKKEESLADRRARLASGGRPGGADAFDQSTIAARGGGVWMGGKNLQTGEHEPGSA
jgi:hypothetical protein